jgi:hypothetical protein
MKAEWSNKDSLEIPEITCGDGSVSWSDYKTGTSCDIATVKVIPVEQLLSILPKYDGYIHTKTYPYNETMEDIYSKGYEDGWNVCLKHIKEELDYWEKENETN